MVIKFICTYIEDNIHSPTLFSELSSSPPTVIISNIYNIKPVPNTSISIVTTMLISYKH